MFTLENFSSEVLEMIFDHFGCSCQLLILTEVCPRFDAIISNSSRNMSSVSIRWTSKKDELELPEIRRKYSSLRIVGVTGLSFKLKEFFDEFGENFISLQFYDSTMTTYELHLLLKTTSNLKLLDFAESPILKIEELPKIDLPKLKRLDFKTVDKQSDVRNLVSMVNTSSLEIFLFDDIVTEQKLATPEETADLLNFIKQQTQLISFHLRPSIADAVINYWLSQKELTLRLEEVSLEYLCECQQLNIPSHWKFLETQRDSLSLLIVKSAKLKGEKLQNLLSLKLERLRLFCCEMKWNSDLMTKNTSIKSLKLMYANEYINDESIDAIVRMLISCESLTSLEIAFNGYDERLTSVMVAVANKTSITTLTIHSPGCVNATNFPFVKRLSIHIDSELEGEKDEIVRLVQANPQIKNLTLSHELEDDDDFGDLVKSLLSETAKVSFEDFSE